MKNKIELACLKVDEQFCYVVGDRFQRVLSIFRFVGEAEAQIVGCDAAKVRLEKSDEMAIIVGPKWEVVEKKCHRPAAFINVVEFVSANRGEAIFKWELFANSF